MTKLYEFELVFALPEGEHDPFEISDNILEAGVGDPLIGTGNLPLISVELEVEDEDPESAILGAARAIIARLPDGSLLREVRPDLVSLADVANKLKVKRQALQKREMPLPTMGGFYRVDEIYLILAKACEPGVGKRRARFDLNLARSWFEAGIAARQVNARLTTHQLDPVRLVVQTSSPMTASMPAYIAAQQTGSVARAD